MNGRPIWGVSAWGGFVCLLMAFSSFIHEALAASGVMLLGALVLFAWAAWLEYGRH
ncbi:MAG TPA: hypothetical protein VHR38_07275 [Solirubrobacterales bacterium]|jgi:hypothetical protein|nr:hypothetical protein [Solirubrobacterales bacterium]